MPKWWKKGEKRNKWEKRGENEKNVNIMLKWWNKRIKFQNNAQMVEKRGKTK